MYYLSTRNKNLKFTPAQAIAQGLSREGGLFVPAAFPKIFLGASCVVSGVWDLVSVAALSAQVRKARNQAQQMREDARRQADAVEAEFYKED